MKVTSSYWLGLGSGLILSAMLALVISPQQGQAVIPQEPSSDPTVKQQITQPDAGGTKQADSPSTVQTPESTQPKEPTQPTLGTLSNPQSSTSIKRQFVLPAGASLKRIADLLVAQGFIKDKESFLVSAHQMGVENKFRAGKFTLSIGLTSEEVIKQLMK